ncbi:ATP-binding cassette domain-containing protein [Hydrogenibacillus sp. N12]|uniref:energy-coupling factor ABC transporter ATP-binding protein n=1 Tax=Hydrogenibacillus sp. N12 TaxID=2866627 RepID=UPI001C7D3AE1|nr:ATP-binding cassette domain-containing protein [Hydrogenibacillus sp. N12]QZA32321.1 ATP-binding cassette domain-containing protein [Hydrogenibacillus sp. N12]
MKADSPVVVAEGVGRAVRGRSILDGIDLVVRAGERWGIVGPNGAGKTTLLHLLALLVPPTAGRLAVFGLPAGGRIPVAVRRRLSVVFQDGRLLSGSVLRNVALPLRLRGVPRREARRRAERWLEAFGLLALAGRRAGNLSGGERARLNLARALAVEPELLLLDEPFAAVDASSRKPLQALLRSIVEREGTTLVLISHDYRDLLALTDQVLVLAGGRAVDRGPTAALWARSSRVQALFPDSFGSIAKAGGPGPATDAAAGVIDEGDEGGR